MDSAQTESVYDRLMRETREQKQAESVKTYEQQEWLATALTPIAEKINDEICEGLRKALGEPLRGAVSRQKGSCAFTTGAEPATERARATFMVALLGHGPEFDDPAKVQYVLNISLYAKPGPGKVTGNVQTVKANPAYYGPGQPGISEQDVQSAVINELIRISRDGK